MKARIACGDGAARPSTADAPQTGLHLHNPRVAARRYTADTPKKTAQSDTPRLTPAYGLKTLHELKKNHHLDLRRTGASIALVRSMQLRTAQASGKPMTAPELMSPKSPRSDPGGRRMALAPSSKFYSNDVDDEVETVINDEHPSQPKSPARRRSKAAEWNSHIARTMTFELTEPVDIDTLEDAFYAIAASFDMDGDGTLDSEELIHIFGRCQMFDDWLTPSKVRDYFITASHGCNYVLSDFETGFSNGIDFEDFESVLRWSADMKGVELANCVQRVVRLSRRLCDGRSSDRRKLETVFDAFCKARAEYMTPYEFANLCKKLGLCKDSTFTVADVYQIYFTSLNVGPEGMNFDEFMKMLSICGERLRMGDGVFSFFAGAVEKLDVDEPTLRMIKMKIKHAASSASDIGWRQFFHECDEDDSGHMDWDEFYAMCRDRLHLTDRANHLKLLFEKLDADDSGELSIDELIDFIEQTSASA